MRRAEAQPVAAQPVATQPVAAPPERQEVRFFAHKAEIIRRDHGIVTHLEVAVAPGDDVEVRRITIAIDGDEPRRLLIASSAEVVLGSQAGAGFQEALKARGPWPVGAAREGRQKDREARTTVVAGKSHDLVVYAVLHRFPSFPARVIHDRRQADDHASDGAPSAATDRVRPAAEAQNPLPGTAP
jgi:hypothetical protein